MSSKQRNAEKRRNRLDAILADDGRSVAMNHGDDGPYKIVKAIGGSDVCETCAAHCVAIQDLEAKLADLIDTLIACAECTPDGDPSGDYARAVLDKYQIAWGAVPDLTAA